jgi:hypothetical protein
MDTLAPDHDHNSGAIRGLLCRRHNSGLGLMGDCQEAIGYVLDYLQNNMNNGDKNEVSVSK